MVSMFVWWFGSMGRSLSWPCGCGLCGFMRICALWVLDNHVHVEMLMSTLVLMGANHSGVEVMWNTLRSSVKQESTAWWKLSLSRAGPSSPRWPPSSKPFSYDIISQLRTSCEAWDLLIIIASKVQERCQEETLELVNRTTTEEEARWVYLVIIMQFGLKTLTSL